MTRCRVSWFLLRKGIVLLKSLTEQKLRLYAFVKGFPDEIFECNTFNKTGHSGRKDML